MNTLLTQGFALASVALVSIYPTPQDFKAAWVPSLSQTYFRPIQSQDGDEMRIVTGTYSRDTATEVFYDPAADCLTVTTQLETPLVLHCASQLHRTILTAQIETEGLALSDHSVAVPSPDVEDARLALAKLCRAVWAASEGDPRSLMTPACADYARGIAGSFSFE